MRLAGGSVVLLGIGVACVRSPAADSPPMPEKECVEKATAATASSRASEPPAPAPAPPPAPVAPTGRRADDRGLFDRAAKLGEEGELDAMEKAFADWRREYGKDPGNEEDWIRSYFLAARAHAALHQFSEVTALQDAAIAAWKERGAHRGTDSASMVAEILFFRVEPKRRAFDRFRFMVAPTTKQVADAKFDELDLLSKEARRAYDEVKHLDTATWTAAADVRIGDIFFCHARRLEEIPMPANLAAQTQSSPGSPNIQKQYLEALHALGEPLREQARKHWKQAAALVKRQSVTGRWADVASERHAGTRLPGC